jgi:hypothetical protein
MSAEVATALGGIAALSAIVLGVVLRFSTAATPTRHHRHHHREASPDLGWTRRTGPEAWPSRWLADDVVFGPNAFDRAVDIVTGPVGQTSFTAFTALSRDERDPGSAVVILHLHAELPRTSIEPRRSATMRLRPFGQLDVLTGVPQFDQQYRVRSDDPSFARTLLGAPMLGWLLGPEATSHTFAVAGSDLVTWRDGPLDVGSVCGWVAELTQFAQQVDPNVWRVYARPLTDDRSVPARL